MLSRDTSSGMLGVGCFTSQDSAADLAELDQLDAFRREAARARLAESLPRGLAPSASTSSIATNADNDAVFKAVWNDDDPAGAREFYFYFCADSGEAQLDQIRPPRTVVLPQTLRKPRRGDGKRAGLYSLDDLRCGALIEVQGRWLRLVACAKPGAAPLCDAHGLADELAARAPAAAVEKMRVGLAGVDLRHRGLLSDEQVARVLRNLDAAPSLSDAQLEVLVGQFATHPGSRIIDYNALADRFGSPECSFGRFSAETCEYLNRGRRQHKLEEQEHARAVYLTLIGRGGGHLD